MHTQRGRLAIGLIIVAALFIGTMTALIAAAEPRHRQTTASDTTDQTDTTSSVTRRGTTTTTEDPNVALWYKHIEEEAFYAGLPTTTTTTTPKPKPRPASAPVEAAPAAESGGGTSAFLECVKQRESGGNYAVSDPTYQWHGAYQFSQGTWNATASRAGRPDLVGVNPANASAADQDAMAQYLYSTQGSSPWAGGSHPC